MSSGYLCRTMDNVDFGVTREVLRTAGFIADKPMSGLYPYVARSVIAQLQQRIGRPVRLPYALTHRDDAVMILPFRQTSEGLQS